MYQQQQQQQQQHSGGCKGRMSQHFAKRFSGHMPPWARSLGWGSTNPAANIHEHDDRFEVWLYAAGLQKDKVKISILEDVLTVAYAAPEATAANTLTEHTGTSWQRRFALNGKVLNTGLSARYEDGILRITLPKNPETNVPAVEVPVS